MRQESEKGKEETANKHQTKQTTHQADPFPSRNRRIPHTMTNHQQFKFNSQRTSRTNPISITTLTTTINHKNSAESPL